MIPCEVTQGKQQANECHQGRCPRQAPGESGEERVSHAADERHRNAAQSSVGAVIYDTAVPLVIDAAG